MQFLVLGPLEVVAEGRPVALRAAKQRALLAALLVNANQSVATDRLIDALWEGRPPASAVKTLQTYVSQLRRELEPGLEPGACQALQTVDGGYRLRVDPDRLDARCFERLAEEGRRALNRVQPATAVAWLREGLALWRGPALRGAGRRAVRTSRGGPTGGAPAGCAGMADGGRARPRRPHGAGR